MRNLEFATLGSTLVILGIVFSQDRLISYSFFGVGTLLSIISAIRLGKKARKQDHSTGGM